MSKEQPPQEQPEREDSKEATDPYGLNIVHESKREELDTKSKADSFFTANAGAMIDRSFRDDESSVINNRTVQDNISENSLGQPSHLDKPMTIQAPSEAGVEHFNKLDGVDLGDDDSSYHANKNLTKAVRDEEEAKKALERLRATIDLEDQKKMES